jgi:hypothetical protein
MIPALSFLALILSLVMVPNEAWAYLDPGTGSYMLSMAMAGIFAGLFTIKTYWQRLKYWFKGAPKSAENREGSGSTDEQR